MATAHKPGIDEDISDSQIGRRSGRLREEGALHDSGRAK